MTAVSATTVIRDVRIFDGEQMTGTVLVRGGAIAQTGGVVPPGAGAVDGPGGTLLPGLIDSHVHAARPAWPAWRRSGCPSRPAGGRLHAVLPRAVRRHGADAIQ
jgi:cytosine/adenosine deaminase-related metal-dependent hydrolase